MINDEYYIWVAENNHGVLDALDEYSEEVLLKRSIVINKSSLKFELNYGDDTKKLPDVIYQPNMIISDNLYDFFLDLKLNYLDFSLSSILGYTDKYYSLRVANYIDYIDKRKSKLKEENGKVVSVETLSFLEELNNIPLKERLIFRVGHSPVIAIHYSISESIEELGISGVRFVPVSTWDYWCTTR